MTISTVNSQTPSAAQTNTTAPANTAASSTATPGTTDTLISAATAQVFSCLSCVSTVVDTVTFPARWTVCILYRLTLFRILFSPIEYVYNKIIDLYDKCRFSIENRNRTSQLTFSPQQLEQMQRNYWALGNEKWKEGVESHYHTYGSYVFDNGLHGGSIEPGFKRSWDRAAHYLSYQFQRKVDARFYLDLHKVACSHFMGAANDVLMGQEKVGVFRGSDDNIQWTCSAPTYTPTAEVRLELDAMNVDILQRFGINLAQFINNADGTVTLKYTTMSRENAEAIYNYFAQTMHAELERAQNADEKLTAVCKFFRNSEWLHAVRDGCGRSDLMTFNFLLTQNGFHPVIMDYSYLASTVGLTTWVNYVRQGLTAWEALPRTV